MKPSRLITLLTKLIAAKKPVLIKGRPGAGKTEIIRQVADALDAEFVLMHPITDEPVDYKGFPFMVETGKGNGERQAEFALYGNLRQLVKPTTKKKLIVCLIDDVGQATPAVQAALMHPVLAREINGHKIDPRVTFVLATNRREDRAAVTGLIAPLIDRMVAVYQLDPDANDWVTWGLMAGVPPVLLAFVKMFPKWIVDYDPTKARDLVKTTSPRTLYEVGEMWKLGIDELDAIEGAAGLAFATEFLAFAQTFGDLPDRDEILMNPKKAPVPPADRPDVLLALMGALAYAASPDNFDAIMTYLDRLAPEYAVCCVKNATARDRSLIQTSAYIGFVTKNQRLFGLATR